MRDYDMVEKNLKQAYKGLLNLKKQLTVEEYLQDRYLVRQVCISSIALACLEESVEAFLVFQYTLAEDDRLLLLDLTGER